MGKWLDVYFGFVYRQTYSIDANDMTATNKEILMKKTKQTDTQTNAILL
jgi:hypothetical protein